MRFRVAGFWRRTGAAVIDAVVVGVSLGLLGLIVGLILGARIPRLREIGLDYLVELALGGGTAVIAGLVCAVLVALLYFLWFHAMSGQTVGKRACRIKVITAYGRPLGFARAGVRLLGYGLSALMLSLGFVWIGFDREKRGLHDWLAGTYVVRT
jgi:uncharacterized RDD family membrane protein YckC